MDTILAQFLARAWDEVGVEEIPRGSNWGPGPKKYLAKTGIREPAYWCAAFVAWVGDSTGDASGWDWPLPLTASCDVLLDFARRRGILFRTPEPGDLFLVCATDTDATHTGIVVAVNDDGTIETYEGNSNSDGSRNGYEVAHRPRRSRSRLKFVRWRLLVASPAAPLPPWSVWWNGQNLGEAWLSGGANWFPTRPLIERVKGVTATTAHLQHDAGDNALLWNHTPVPVPVVLRDNREWGQLRPLATWLGLRVEADEKTRRVLLTPSS